MPLSDEVDTSQQTDEIVATLPPSLFGYAEPEESPVEPPLYQGVSKKAKKDPQVHHPNHYNMGKTEVWDFILEQDLPYCLGNVVKYIARAGKKHPNMYLEDLLKAQAYLNKEIGRLTDEDL